MSATQSYINEQLLAGLKKGDRKAFASIYKQYAEALMAHVRLRVPNREDAQDIVQDLFMSLWKNRETLAPDTKLSAYLFVAARYKVINYIARDRSQQSLAESLRAWFPEATYHTDHVLRTRMTEELIEKEVAQLPQKMQVIFRKSRGEQLSHKEIAQQLEISETTVKKQVANALRILRPKLEMLSLFCFFCLA